MAAAVAAPDRPADQVELDASRKPVEVLTFFGLKPGDRVLTEALTYPGMKALSNLLHLPLEGVAMELEDCGFPTLADIVTTDDANRAFKDANFALLVGSSPRKQGQERKDLLNINGKIFIGQGQAIARSAKPDERATGATSTAERPAIADRARTPSAAKRTNQATSTSVAPVRAS